MYAKINMYTRIFCPTSLRHSDLSKLCTHFHFLQSCLLTRLDMSLDLRLFTKPGLELEIIMDDFLASRDARSPLLSPTCIDKVER